MKASAGEGVSEADPVPPPKVEAVGYAFGRGLQPAYIVRKAVFGLEMSQAHLPILHPRSPSCHLALACPLGLVVGFYTPVASKCGSWKVFIIGLKAI